MPLIEVEAERAAAAVSAAAVPAVVARRASGRLLLLLLRKHTTKGQPLRERRRTHSPHALARPLEPPGAPPPRRRTRGASPRENEQTLDTRERAALERDRRALRWRAARRAARRTAPAAAAAPPGIRATAAPAATAHVAARDTIDIVGRAARELRVVAVALRRLLAAAPVDRAAAPCQVPTRATTRHHRHRRRANRAVGYGYTPTPSQQPNPAASRLSWLLPALFACFRSHFAARNPQSTRSQNLTADCDCRPSQYPHTMRFF